ncbi:hypothetical protein [uncultured Mediterranean phage uvMED]|nr:hypothetical protein [uncultured Mediterranean phage uvMED]
MSQWVTEDLDNTSITQKFKIKRRHNVANFVVKFIKRGSVNSTATVKLQVFDGNIELYSKEVTGSYLNSLTSDDYLRVDVNFPVDDLVLNTSLDGTEKEYALHFSSSNYTENQFLICKRQFNDSNAKIYGSYLHEFNDSDKMLDMPIFFEIEEYL